MNLAEDNIIKIIKNNNIPAFLVGGCIRDSLLGKTSYDRDIVTQNAEYYAKMLAQILDAYFITLDAENKIYRLVLKDKVNYIDVSEMVGNCIQGDLSRRDFTINSIAYDILNNKFVDTTNGLDDIKNKIIRHVKEENFIDDPLRILRCFRFASTTGFKIDKNTQLLINKYSELLNKPSKERINYELMKLLGGENSAEILLDMDKNGILEIIFPIINDLKKVPKNSHHHLDLFYHSIETVRNIELLFKESEQEVKEHLSRVDFGGFPRINHLKLAGFLHDIGKFSTWTIDEDDRHRFIKHDDVGSKICVPILRELKFSNKQIEYVSLMIKKHIYPSNIIDAPELNDKIKMRYLRKMEENVIDNIFIAKADRLSARGEEITEEILKHNLNGLNELLSFYLKNKDLLKPLPKLLDGNEIMQIIDIKSGKELGDIIKQLKEAQINSEVQTKDEAINFIKNIKKEGDF